MDRGFTVDERYALERLPVVEKPWILCLLEPKRQHMTSIG